MYYIFKRESNKKLCEEILHEAAKRHNIEITELCVMSGHIPIVVVILPTMSISKALKLLKDASERELFERKTYFIGRYPKRKFLEPREIL